MKRFYWFGLFSSFLWIIGGNISPTIAQVVPDATLSHPSRVRQTGNAIVITGGSQSGRNLFHSFQTFSVPESATASFRNIDAAIANVFARVTGGHPSRINGRIEMRRSNGSISSANLFLLNPSGIIFGQNASLNIGGSFLATTAEQINFADGTQFSAVNPASAPLLTVSTPIGLQVGSNPGQIVNQSFAQQLDSAGNPVLDEQGEPIYVGLQVQPEQTLALVGGDVSLPGGRIRTSAGRVELGSVLSPGLVSLTPTDTGWRLGYDGVQRFGTIQLSFRANIVDQGNAGGAIQVRGRQIRLSDGSQIVSVTQGDADGEPLSIRATGSVDLTGVYLGEPSSLETVTYGSGRAGAMRIDAPQLSIRNGAQVGSTTLGRGQGGNVTVYARRSLTVDGAVQDGIDRFFSLLYAQTRGSGNAGNLTVTTHSLQAQAGGQVSSTTFAAGRAGNLTIRASAIDLNGVARSPDGSLLLSRRSAPVPSGVFSGAEPGNERVTGRAGQVNLTTNDLTIRNQAVVGVASINRLRDKPGAGDIRIQARSILLDNQGRLNAETRSGRGGKINLDVSDALILRRGSQISTTAGVINAGGNGGNITINADSIIAAPSENSDIRANAYSGKGGNVTIDTSRYLGIGPRDRPTATSDITASSELGTNGEIAISTPDIDPTRGLVELPTDIVDASQLIAQSCPIGGSSTERLSRFVVTGRGGVPPSPTDLQRSDAIQSGWATLEATTREQSRQRPQRPSSAQVPVRAGSGIVEAQGWVVDANGAVMLIAQAPTVTPHNFGLTDGGCGDRQSSRTIHN
jgi:filamentous hemagglutinin family protein